HALAKVKFHRVFPRGEWRLQYAWQQNHRQEFDLRRSGLSRLPAIDLKLNTHTLDQEWQFATPENRKLLVGLNTMLQNNQNIPGTQRIPFIPNFTTATAGLFGAASKTAGNLTSDIGLRYDIRNYDVVGYDFKNTLYRSQLLFHNFSGTGGIVYDFGNGQSVKSTLSTAWRPPHVAELFSLGTHQSAAAIEYGLFLDPETNEIRAANDVRFRNEQAVKWVGSWSRQSRRADIEITTYANSIANYFWLRPGGITKNIRGAYPYFRNTQTDALFLGADVELTYRINEKLSVIPRGSFIRASDLRNKDFLIGIPANRAETTLRYSHTAGKGVQLTAETKGSRIGRQRRAPREITAQQFLDAEKAGADPLGGSNSNFDFLAAPQGYFLWQAAASVTITTGSVRHEIRLSAENILNNQYRDYTNRFRYYADEIGRNIRLSFKSIF
ncbi:MAG: TonB-dependent receptor domain-containing protein, partial [Bacteroidota bacterium]